VVTVYRFGLLMIQQFFGVKDINHFCLTHGSYDKIETIAMAVMNFTDDRLEWINIIRFMDWEKQSLLMHLCQ